MKCDSRSYPKRGTWASNHHLWPAVPRSAETTSSSLCDHFSNCHSFLAGTVPSLSPQSMVLLCIYHGILLLITKRFVFDYFFFCNKITVMYSFPFLKFSKLFSPFPFFFKKKETLALFYIKKKEKKRQTISKFSTYVVVICSFEGGWSFEILG